MNVVNVVAPILEVVVHGVVVEFPVLVDASEMMKSVVGDELLKEVIVDVVVI